MEKKFFSHLGVVMYLFKEISTASEFFECGHIANDFLIDGQKINDWFRSHDMKPFYVCVRNAGTETGFYDDVLTQCLSLGRPVKVYVIAKSDFGEFIVDTRSNLWAVPNKYHELAEFLYNRYGVEKGNEILAKGNIGNLAKLYV